MKTSEYWTRKELEALPERNWNENIGEFDSLIILPTRWIHDSGYRCMDFVATRDNVPFIRLSGCSDVIHINGIGGMGYNWLKKFGKCPDAIPPIGWNIDCLKTSGLLRLFTHKNLVAGDALSSFEIFTK
jgi:hypothetical protein